MIGAPLSRRTTVIITLVSVALIIAAYFALSAWKHGINPSDKTVPSLAQLHGGWMNLWQVRKGEGRWFLIDLQASSLRFALGLALGATAGFFLGLLTGCYRTVHAAFVPVLSVLSNVPAMAMIAVYYIFVPRGHTMFVTMVAFGVLPVVVHGVRLAVQAIPPALLDTAYMRGASTFEVIAHVIVPQLLPRFVDLVILSSATAFMVLLGAEMSLGGGQGIGYRINNVMMKSEMSMIIPYLAVLAVSGIAIAYGLGAVQKWRFPWYNPEKR